MSVQSPMQEVADDVADTLPKIEAAAHLSALEDLRRNQAALRRRVQDSHKWQAAALGMETTDAEEDEMGNLVLTGDIYGGNPADVIRGLQGLPAETPSTPGVSPITQAAETAAKVVPAVASMATPTWAKVAALGASLIASGGLGGWLAKPAAPVPPAPVVAPIVQQSAAQPENWILEVVPPDPTEPATK